MWTVSQPPVFLFEQFETGRLLTDSVIDPGLIGHRLRIMADEVVPFEWASAKLAEREAFNRISEARTQAAWFNAWRTWAAMVQKLHQQAKRPEPTSTPEFLSQDRGWHPR